MSNNWYILVATNYTTKWVEAWTGRTNIFTMTTKFLHKHILIRFGCPLTIVTNQGTHFINDAIMYLIDHFIMRHTLFIYYLLYIHKEMDRLSLQIRFLEPY